MFIPQLASLSSSFKTKTLTMTPAAGKKRSRSAALLTFLTWSAADASPLTQHRVKSPQRRVEYQHTLQNTRRNAYQKFVRSTETHVDLRRRRTLELEDHDQAGRFWMFSQETQPTADKRNQQSNTNNKGYFRRLFDQFVGEDETTGNNNVTTEIDFNFSGSNSSDSIVYTTSNETQNLTEFSPLRIRAVLAEDSNFLTNDERQSLFHEMLSPALLSWSSALRVDPVAGNLTVDPHQLSNGKVCGPGNGLPSIAVPTQHIEAGIPDTDVVVYLSLGFVDPRNKTNGGLYNSTNATSLDDSDMDDRRPKQGNNTEQIDPIENVSFEFPNNVSSSFACSGEYLAAASFCSTDQYDRPTAALMHICIDSTFFEPAKRSRNIATLMHELGHALGFNSLSMAHFRRQDGTPITPRVNGSIPDTKIECTGTSANRTFANVALPSEEILQFRPVRGGVRVAELVTPSILQVVRNQFDCQELTGAELESGEGLPLAMIAEGHGCIGDHWERRLFSTDLMNPVVDDADYSPRISTLTLAYFADSGWYQVDLNYAKVAAGWGRGTGCNFVNDTCIGANGQVPPGNAPFFCNDVPSKNARSIAQDIHGCTPDLSRKAVCKIGMYDHALPTEFQYFQDTYGSNVGGSDPFMDYCPVYSGFDNGLCSNIENEQYIKASQIETFGRRNSRCLLGDVGNIHKTALCLPIACVVEDEALLINVDSQWHTCKEAGQVISSVSASVVCPDPRRICPTFYCPFDCLGTGGICDYPSGECMCEYPNLLSSLGDSVIIAACGSMKDPELSGGADKPQNAPIILHGDSGGNKHVILPPPDSPLSDYYVPNTGALEEKRSKPTWSLVIALGVGGVFLLILGFLFREWYKRQTTETGITPTGNRNKDKMVATILFDMRIHGGGPPLNESLAETDERLTESVASGMPSDMSDISFSRRSESILSEDTLHAGDLENVSQEVSQEVVLDEPQIIRRRKAGTDGELCI